MFKSVKVAGPAAFSLLMLSFLGASGATIAASAQAQPFEAPAIVAPAVATPVQPTVSEDSINSAAAANDAPGSLDELVSAWQDDGTLDAETRCLATAIYYEARSESLQGQLAVANVVLARAQSGRFADTLCGVVTQRGQFGFVRKGRMPAAPQDSSQWRTAKAIADIARDGALKNPVEGALFFHATYSEADWDRPRVAQIGRHVFYR